MVEDKYISLMHQEIDEANSADDTAALKAYLTNPEAQDYYKELKDLSALLNKVPALEPSAGLPHQIMQALPADLYARKKEMNASLAEDIIEFLRQRILHRYALAFSVGVVAGALILLLINYPKSYDHSEVIGSIGLGPAWTKTADVSFQEAEIQGELVIKRTPAKMLAELHLRSAGSVEAMVEFDPNHYTVNAFQFSENSVPVQMSASSCQITNTGDHRYVILFNELSPAPVHLRIQSSERMLYQTTLDAPGDR